MTTRTRVLLIGAGGHARVVLEALGDSSSYEVVGAVSADGLGIDRLGVPMLGTDSALAEVAEMHGIELACPAIGDNASRQRAAERWAGGGRGIATAVSRSAVVSATVDVGRGVAILPAAVVNAATRVGDGAIVNTNASIDHDCQIGEYAHVAPGCAIAGGVVIGARTLVGIGARILPGIKVGSDAIIGAGAVVTSDVGDGTVVVGVPARPLRRQG